MMNERGQYILPMLLTVMLLISLIVIFFSSMSQVTSNINYPRTPNLGRFDNRAMQMIWMGDVSRRVYNKRSDMSNMISTIQNHATTLGLSSSISATDTTGYPNSTCSSIQTNSNGAFTRESDQTKYSSDMETYLCLSILPYSDDSYSNGTDYFHNDSTVYLWIYGRYGHHANVSVFTPDGTLFKNWTAILYNYHTTGEFTPNETGEWTVKVNDTDANYQIEKTVYVDTIDMTVKTYDTGGTEKSIFGQGDTINVTVWLKNESGDPIDCEVKIDLASAIGSQDYGYQADTSNGTISHIFQLSNNEPVGNMTLAVTEHCRWSTYTKQIKVEES